jgi:arylsulfatase A-like enzyme
VSPTVARAIALVSLALGVAGAALLWRGDPARARRDAPFNVLFLSLDTVRQDVLGAYGHRPKRAPGASTTPMLDQLAREGVRMADAYASSSWTLPSHMSMMTGRPALAHGVETESGVLDPAIPTMAEILSNHGYRTAGIYSAPYLDPHWGFGRGFETYTAVYGEEAAAVARRVAGIREEVERAATAGDWERYDELKRRQAAIETELNDRSQTVVTSEQVAAATVAKLEDLARDGRPWFVFAHFFDAHCDYVPPPPYDRRFDPDYGGSFTGEGCMGGPAVGTPDPNQPGALLRTIGARDLEHAFALYEGEVASVDDHVGVILRALERLKLADQTLVIVASDHGEEFFEHAGLGHRRTLYDEVTRVPLLLRLPHVIPANRVIAGAVGVSDLLPTTLDLLGIRYEASDAGTSFWPAVRDDVPAEHGALLRTIVMFGGSVRVDGGATVALRQVFVQDGFRHGAIKITRQRDWPQFQAGVAADVRSVLQPEAARQWARETLRWIDVTRHPDEPSDRWSTDFTDPAARAALAAFRAAYEHALARRPPPAQSSTLPHNVRSALESLGYIERGTGPAFPEPDLVLPPPPGS